MNGLGEEEVAPKPEFFSEVTRQTRFVCTACGTRHDILGLFAYCSCCGTRNDIQVFEKKMADIRTTLGGGGFPSTAVRDAVAAFDTLARYYSRKLVALIPMTPARKASWARASFHSFTDIEQK